MVSGSDDYHCTKYYTTYSISRAFIWAYFDSQSLEKFSIKKKKKTLKKSVVGGKWKKTLLFHGIYKYFLSG